MPTTNDVTAKFRFETAEGEAGIRRVKGGFTELASSVSPANSKFDELARHANHSSHNMMALQQSAIRASSSVSSALATMNDRMMAFDMTLGKTTQAMNTAGNWTLGIAAGAGAGEVAMVKLAASFEQTRMAFTALLGSEQAANEFLRDLQDFAKVTPYQFTDLTTQARQLMAYGFAAKEIIPILTNLGDAVAAMGGNAAMLDRVTYAIGQIRSKGKLESQDMRQLMEARIPILEALSKRLNVSESDVWDLVEKKMIDSKTAIDAMSEGLAEKFGGFMDKAAQTTAGRWSNLVDKLTILAIEAGEKLLPAANELIDHISKIADWLATLNPSMLTFGTLALFVAGGMMKLAPVILQGATYWELHKKALEADAAAATAAKIANEQAAAAATVAAQTAANRAAFASAGATAGVGRATATDAALMMSWGAIRKREDARLAASEAQIEEDFYKERLAKIQQERGIEYSVLHSQDVRANKAGITGGSSSATTISEETVKQVELTKARMRDLDVEQQQILTARKKASAHADASASIIAAERAEYANRQQRLAQIQKERGGVHTQLADQDRLATRSISEHGFVTPALNAQVSEYKSQAQAQLKSLDTEQKRILSMQEKASARLEVASAKASEASKEVERLNAQLTQVQASRGAAYAELAEQERVINSTRNAQSRTGSMAAAAELAEQKALTQARIQDLDIEQREILVSQEKVTAKKRAALALEEEAAATLNAMRATNALAGAEEREILVSRGRGAKTPVPIPTPSSGGGGIISALGGPVGIGITAALIAIPAGMAAWDAAIDRRANKLHSELQAMDALKQRRETEAEALRTLGEAYEKLSSSSDHSAGAQKRLTAVKADLQSQMQRISTVLGEQIPKVGDLTGQWQGQLKALEDFTKFQREYERKQAEADAAEAKSQLDKIGRNKAIWAGLASAVTGNQQYLVNVGESVAKDPAFQAAQARLDAANAKLHGLDVLDRVDKAGGNAGTSNIVVENTLKTLEKALGQAAQKEAALRDEFDLGATQAKLYAKAIEDLIEAGVSGSDPQVVNLYAKLQESMQATDAEIERQAQVLRENAELRVKAAADVQKSEAEIATLQEQAKAAHSDVERTRLDGVITTKQVEQSWNERLAQQQITLNGWVNKEGLTKKQQADRQSEANRLATALQTERDIALARVQFEAWAEEQAAAERKRRRDNQDQGDIEANQERHTQEGIWRQLARSQRAEGRSSSLADLYRQQSQTNDLQADADYEKAKAEEVTAYRLQLDAETDEDKRTAIEKAHTLAMQDIEAERDARKSSNADDLEQKLYNLDVADRARKLADALSDLNASRRKNAVGMQGFVEDLQASRLDKIWGTDRFALMAQANAIERNQQLDMAQLQEQYAQKKRNAEDLLGDARVKALATAEAEYLKGMDDISTKYAQQRIKLQFDVDDSNLNQWKKYLTDFWGSDTGYKGTEFKKGIMAGFNNPWLQTQMDGFRFNQLGTMPALPAMSTLPTLPIPTITPAVRPAGADQKQVIVLRVEETNGFFNFVAETAEGAAIEVVRHVTRSMV